MTREVLLSSHAIGHTAGVSTEITDSATAESLPAFVNRRMIELGITSVRQLARLSRGGVSHEIANRVVRGTHTGNLAPETARALATALQVPVADVWAAAAVTWYDGAELVATVRRLSPVDRRRVEEFARSLLPRA